MTFGVARVIVTVGLDGYVVRRFLVTLSVTETKMATESLDKHVFITALLNLGYMDWIGLAQERDRWRTLVSAVMNLRVP